MKRAFHAIMVLAVSAFLFTSCKKDKDDPTVEGRWGITYSDWKHTVNGQMNGGDMETYTSDSEEYYTLELTADGKFSEKDNDGEILDRGDYRIDGNKIYYKYAGTVEEDVYDFTVTEGEFTLKYHLAETISGNAHVWESTEKYKRL